MGIIPRKIKYIELSPGTSIPKTSLDEFLLDISHVKDAAILLDKDVIVVDFDHVGSTWKYLMDKYTTRVIKTTRGAHMYFKMPSTMKTLKNHIKCMTYCGLQVDYKTGFGNKKAMAKVKVDGKMREVLKDVAMEDLQELPLWLYPLPHVKDNLYALDDGDGRNDSIFKHVLQLRNKKVKTEEILGIAEFINETVFKTPLERTEFINVLKSALEYNSKEKPDMNFWTEDKNGNMKLDIFKLSDFVCKDLDVRIYNGIFYYLNEERFIANIQQGLLRTIQDKYQMQLKKSQDMEILHQLSKMAKLENEDSYPIAFRNGFLLDGAEILRMDTIFTPFQLDVDYDPDAICEDVDSYIRWFCNNREDLILLFGEILGHILMTSGFPHHVFFFMANSGSNGKSTTLNMINNFVGNLHSSISLDEFERPENLFQINGKLVNCGDDIDASLIEKSRTFKTLAAGNEIMAKALYENPVRMKSVATLIFSCNEMPNFKDKSGGIARRVVCFPCDAKVKEIDMKIDEKLSTDQAKSRLLNIALNGMRRIIKNSGKLTQSKTVQDLTQRYLIDTDSVSLFLEEYLEIYEEHILMGMDYKKFYLNYTNFCYVDGLHPISKKKLTTRLNSLGFETYKSNSKIKIRKKGMVW